MKRLFRGKIQNLKEFDFVILEIRNFIFINNVLKSNSSKIVQQVPKITFLSYPEILFLRRKRVFRFKSMKNALCTRLKRVLNAFFFPFLRVKYAFILKFFLIIRAFIRPFFNSRVRKIGLTFDFFYKFIYKLKK